MSHVTKPTFKFTALVLAGASFFSITLGCGGGGGGSEPTPTPSATPSPTPVPTPTPTPTPTPAPALLAYYPGYTSGDFLTYLAKRKSTVMVEGVPEVTESQEEVTEAPGGLVGVNPGEQPGKQESVSLSGDTVTREERLDPAGKLVGYEYFRLDGPNYRYYGWDAVNPTTGSVTERNRYSPAVAYSLNMAEGETTSYSGSLTGESVGPEGSTPSFSAAVTFLIRLTGKANVTVTAGAFTNCALLRQESTSTATGGTEIRTVADLSLAPGIGEVKSTTTITLADGTDEESRELLRGKVGSNSLGTRAVTPRFSYQIPSTLQRLWKVPRYSR